MRDGGVGGRGGEVMDKKERDKKESKLKRLAHSITLSVCWSGIRVRCNREHAAETLQSGSRATPVQEFMPQAPDRWKRKVGRARVAGEQGRMCCGDSRG